MRDVEHEASVAHADGLDVAVARQRHRIRAALAAEHFATIAAVVPAPHHREHRLARHAVRRQLVRDPSGRREQLGVQRECRRSVAERGDGVVVDGERRGAVRRVTQARRRRPVERVRLGRVLSAALVVHRGSLRAGRRLVQPKRHTVGRRASPLVFLFRWRLLTRECQVRAVVEVPGVLHETGRVAVGLLFAVIDLVGRLFLVRLRAINWRLHLRGKASRERRART